MEQRLNSVELELSQAKVECDVQAKEKDEVKEEIEHTFFQLNEVQEELESVFHADQIKQNYIDELEQRLNSVEVELARVNVDLDVQVKEKDKAKEEIDHKFFQLNQLQEELETVFHSDQAKKNHIEELRQHLNSVEVELARVKVEFDSQVKQKEEVNEEAELTLLQLHQVQEELERSFLESRVQGDLLRQHNTHALAMRQAIANLIVRCV
ncbi:hypothetical protein [Synechococcus sp. RS9902]|uniref:hypothetical protein n=1 Tax=Synechococcus sp. RS9902 TaxID=221345 RepID=UPI001646C3BA|nr:hypothetical protein [Synechococcus sp. RS9902]QNI96567.1 hypothetical protein SynRS9902_00665 [Synechococcus sp. RS9902]